jgi:hypothetical protein
VIKKFFNIRSFETTNTSIAINATEIFRITATGNVVFQDNNNYRFNVGAQDYDVEKPMVSFAVNELSKPPIFNFPTPTASIVPTTVGYCGSTISTSYDIKKEIPIDPNLLDPAPLKKYLQRKYPWILDVTEVRKGSYRRIYADNNEKGSLEIHITISPLHHTELMDPSIERKVRKKLLEEIIPMVTCIYGYDFLHEPPLIVFSPTKSETILELI